MLCEKPLGINEKEVALMIKTAQENNAFLMEALWMKCFPLIKKMDQVLN